jgi:hypothetical protein
MTVWTMILMFVKVCEFEAFSVRALRRCWRRVRLQVQSLYRWPIFHTLLGLLHRGSCLEVWDCRLRGCESRWFAALVSGWV